MNEIYVTYYVVSILFLKLLSRGNVRFFDFHEGRYFWTSAFRSC